MYNSYHVQLCEEDYNRWSHELGQVLRAWHAQSGKDPSGKEVARRSEKIFERQRSGIRLALIRNCFYFFTVFVPMNYSCCSPNSWL
jgi:hypothetical protein